MIKESLHQEDIMYLIVHALKAGSECTRKNLTEMKEDRDRSTVVTGDTNMCSFVSQRENSRAENQRGCQTAQPTANQPDVINSVLVNHHQPARPARPNALPTIDQLERIDFMLCQPSSTSQI